MNKLVKISVLPFALALLVPLQYAEAAIAGIGRVAGGSNCSGSTCSFSLTARTGQITLGDGNQLLAWGYGTGATMQYPGPTLIVDQGDTVEVTLSNTLRLPVSIVFPGQTGVTTTGGDIDGLLTREVAAGGAGTPVTYTFDASAPGTYLYHSGTQTDLQIEMGLVGTLIVRPSGFDESSANNRRAYGHKSSAYDREYLFFMSEIDRCLHAAEDVIQQALAASQTPPDPLTHDAPDVCTKVDAASIKSTLWFLNGRNAPDTLLKANVGWLPLQPYNALARMHPGERVLMRLVGGGSEIHPFHHHGNNAWMIARDGRVLESATNANEKYPDFEDTAPALADKGTKLPDQAISNFTIQTPPGSTIDAIFTWTGKGLNWDPYGHGGDDCSSPAAEAASRLELEDPASHCMPFPVTLPEQQAVTMGGFWTGSPFLEGALPIPPLQGGLNPGNGYTFMWHSHTERELTNDDVFPGGMMTMLIIEGPGVVIDAAGDID